MSERLPKCFIPKPAPRSKRSKRASYLREAAAPLKPIKIWFDERMKHVRWKVQDPGAWDEIRAAIFARQGARCSCCGCSIWMDDSELHHRRGRKHRCDCPDCNQLLCKTRFLEDNTRRAGCHELVHAKGDLRKDFVRAL